MKKIEGEVIDIDLQIKKEEEDAMSKNEQPICRDAGPHQVNAIHFFTSIHPHFAVQIKFSSLTTPFQLNVPAAFAKNNFPCFSKHISLRNHEGKKWRVLFYFDYGLHSFTNGWKAFALDNFLQVGDHCVFELVDEFELLCYIYRVNDNKCLLEDTQSTSTKRSRMVYEESLKGEEMVVKLAPEIPDASSCVTKCKLQPSASDKGESVDSLLQSLSLEKYSETFHAEEIDIVALKLMTEEDLKFLGVPMGPRKKILEALNPKA